METKRKPIARGNSWYAPAFALATLCLFGCLLLLALGVGGAVIANLARPGKEVARVQDVRGILEMQDQDGVWHPIAENDRVASGARMRTGALSQAHLKLKDGSILELAAGTEITLDQAERFLSGRRMVRISQWRGETNHQVSANRKPDSLYAVKTNAATLRATGTTFTVQVHADQRTNVSVESGRVEVSGAETTISLAPGQTATVTLGKPPTAAAYQVRGTGILAVSEAGWTIAGVPVSASGSDAFGFTPQSGDRVSFVGRQRSDGSVEIESLRFLAHPSSNSFLLSGEMEDSASTALIVSGQYIRLDERTSVAIETDSHKAVVVRGGISPEGVWLAEGVYSAANGQPFQFVGVVQEHGDDIWIISGLEILTDENTAVSPDMMPGDVVEVIGWQSNGDWLAATIQPFSDPDAQFDFIGTVEDTNPWVVSGVPIQIDSWSFIESGIQTGDQVRVQGSVFDDGTWVAASVTLVAELPEGASVTLTGIVNGISPWVISGMPFIVDASTQWSAEIAVGDLVQVSATLQTNGLWHADIISQVVPGNLGCVTFASVVTAIDGEQISLENGLVIDLNDVAEVEGEIELESVVLVTRCMAADGAVTIPLIRVLSGPAAEPTSTSTPTPTNTPAPTDIILPNCYKITFLGFQDQGDGTSTWRYLVEELSCAQDLSNWMLELPDCAFVSDASPSPWEIVRPDPNHHLNGVKWETGAGFQRGEFSLTLSGELTLGTVHVGAKGPDVEIGQIAGPACAVPASVTPTPTITFTPSPTSMITATATATITPTVTFPSSPTVVPPTATLPPPPTVTPQPPAPPPASSGTINVTDNDQTLTFTCNGNAVVVSGNSNTVTLLGSCSSITVRGNNNQVYWQSGSPTITNTGNNNTILQR
ncbi:MAG: DUF5666 domain-containing protein [Chloroflexota bacterium]